MAISNTGDERPWTFYALGASVRSISGVSLRADGGDLRSVLPGSGRRRDVSHGRHLRELVPRHFPAGTDGQYPGLLLALDDARRRSSARRRWRSRWRPGSPSAGRSRARACCSTWRSPAWSCRASWSASASGWASEFLGTRAEPLHLGARRTAHVDAAVRPVHDVCGGQPVRSNMGRSRQRSRRQLLAAPAACDVADPVSRHHGRGDDRIHAVL